MKGQKSKAQDITIIRQPKTEPYGTVAVFADLYGNLWDLIEPAGLGFSVQRSGCRRAPET